MPRWNNRRYSHEYDNEKDIVDRDTRDRDYVPYDPDRTRRPADGKLLTLLNTKELFGFHLE